MNTDEWDEIQEHIRARKFELSARLPVTWKNRFYRLERAAGHLYDIYYEASTRSVERTLEEVRSGKQSEGTRALEGQELEDAEDGQLLPVSLMLMGYAFENLLKAILMVERREDPDLEQILEGIKSHDLVQLCAACAIPIEKEDADVLEMLKAHVAWIGKYPIPLKFEKSLPLKAKDGREIPEGVSLAQAPKLKEQLDRLSLRFWEELNSRYEPGSYEFARDEGA